MIEKAVRKKKASVRAGRPPRELAGEVDERILQAARSVFLERGLAGASIDEIAGLARAGKPTIYARYPGKEAIFTAVVMRNVATNVAKLGGLVPTGSTLDERLASLATTILHWALAGDTINLMRLGISEARQLPDLAIKTHRMARQRGEEFVGKLLAEAAQSDTRGRLSAFAPEQLAMTTKFFMDLVVFPIIVRALFGENPDTLRAEITPYVARGIAFFLAGCALEKSSSDEDQQILS